MGCGSTTGSQFGYLTKCGEDDYLCATCSRNRIKELEGLLEMIIKAMEEHNEDMDNACLDCGCGSSFGEFVYNLKKKLKQGSE